MAVEIKCDLCGLQVKKLEELKEIKIGPRIGFFKKQDTKEVIVGDICDECKNKVVEAIRKLKTKQPKKKQEKKEQDTKFLGQNRKEETNIKQEDPLMGIIKGDNLLE